MGPFCLTRVAFGCLAVAGHLGARARARRPLRLLTLVALSLPRPLRPRRGLPPRRLVGDLLVLGLVGTTVVPHAAYASGALRWADAEEWASDDDMLAAEDPPADAPHPAPSSPQAMSAEEAPLRTTTAGDPGELKVRGLRLALPLRLRPLLLGVLPARAPGPPVAPGGGKAAGPKDAAHVCGDPVPPPPLPHLANGQISAAPPKAGLSPPYGKMGRQQRLGQG